MKKTLLFVSAIFLAFSCAHAKDKVPSAVTSAFSSKFPDAKEVEWGMEPGENVWEAEFAYNEKDMSASFDMSGKWLETESEVTLVDVPAELVKSVLLKFGDFKTEEISSIQTPDFSGFEILLKKENTEVEILGDATGKITIKDVAVKEGKENHQKEGKVEKKEKGEKGKAKGENKEEKD